VVPKPWIELGFPAQKRVHTAIATRNHEDQTMSTTTTTRHTATAVRMSTTEENVSLRHVWYDVLVDGKYLTSRDNVSDAIDIRDAINDGEDPSTYA
jgi:hypothetical protein